MNRVPRKDAPRVLLASASDNRFFPLLQRMLETLRPAECPGRLSLVCFDIGLTQEQRRWLATFPMQVTQPRPHFGVAADRHPPALLSFLARPFLPEDFPGHDIYLWVDSDVWFQDPRAVDLYIGGASKDGFAIAHESERAYRFQPQLFAWTAKHFLLGYGPLSGAWLLSRRHFNAGIFAGRSDAPHWAAWKEHYQAAIARTGKLVPHDQFALVQTLHAASRHGASFATSILGPACNWIIDRGVPMWNDEARAFCQPYEPYTPISVLHLAGPGKSRVYRVRRTGGGSFETRILPGVSPQRTVVTAVEDLPVTLEATSVVAQVGA